MSTNQKLNQVIAVEKTIKGRVTSEVTKLYHASQKPNLFNGFTKTYKKRREESEGQPPQSQRVQIKAPALVKDVGAYLTELFDVTAAKDFANCAARANVVVDGEILVADAPATFLLFLEKQLTDLHTAVGAIPTLDPADDWRWDEAVELFKTPATVTVSTKKVQRPLVMYDATDKHPAQTQLITEDVDVGEWEHVKMSGALTDDRKRVLLGRIEQLQRAVKFAREAANGVEAPQKEVGAKVFAWLWR